MGDRWAWPAAAAAWGATSAALLLRRGVVMGPDSWAYWEGSVSLLERGQYAYFGGAPLAAFPPLFSALLALVQAGLGVSARTLAVALVALAAAGSFAWTALYRSLAGERSRADALAAVALPATVALSCQALLSEALWLALLPALLALVLASRLTVGRLVGIAALLGAMLLTRNATLALLPGLAALAWRGLEGAPARRALAILAVLAGAILPWIGMRSWLGQIAAHPLGHGAQGTVEYARQALSGLAYGLGPDRWGMGGLLLLALAVLLAWERVPPATAPFRLVALALTGLAGHVLLFRLVFVAEPIRGRFVAFAVLLLLSAVLALARTRRAFLVLAAALTSVALYRVATKARLAGREQPTVALDTRISSSYPSGPPRETETGRLVAPPTYPWIPHR